MAQPAVARIQRRTVAMKVESTYATDAFGGTVAAGDIVEAFNVETNPTINMYEVPFMGGILAGLGALPGVRIGQVTFQVHLRGAGAAYSASVFPNIHNPLRACGYLATLDATGGSEKYTYTPRSSGFESFTIYVMQEEGPTTKMTGCFGDVSFVYQVGLPCIARFVFQGIYNTETDTPTLVTKTFSAAPQWPVMLSGNFTWDAFAAKWLNLQLNSGNIIDVQEDVSAASGISGVFMAGRRPTGTFDPEIVTRATYDYISKWEGSTLVAVSMDSTGAQYVRHKLDVPKAQIIQRGWGVRGQKAVFQVGFAATPNVGDDELQIVFD